MDAAGPTAADLVERPGVRVAAHRGLSARAPENTLPAFRLALDSGADLVELDYRHTRDGVPVTIHDAELARTTNAHGELAGDVATLDLATLQTLDAGGWFDAAFAGTPVPTLEDALAILCPRTSALVERQAGDAKTLIGLLTRRGWLERVIVQSFDLEFLAACRAREPRLILGGLGQGALTPELLARGASLDVTVVGWREEDLDAEVVAAAHAHGLRVWAWTVDTPERAQALIAAGVDGLIGDDPGMLHDVVAGSSGA